MQTRSAVLTAVALLGLLPGSGLAAQATNPAYLGEMPPVERVLREIKDGDPDETAARQMGAFLRFKKIIEKMASYRFYRNQLTRDETRLMQVYYVAYWDIAKTKPEYQKVTGLRGYDIDPKFLGELFNRFFSPAFRAQYEGVDAEFARNRAARAKADTENMMRERAGIADEQQKQGHLAEEQREIRRCVESGRSEVQCMAEGIGKSWKEDMIGGIFPGLKKAPLYGLRMAGMYPGQGKFSLAFYPEKVAVTCEDLMPSEHVYAVAVKEGQVRITIQNDPKPLVLTFRADERLAGPGPVDITGQVVVGSQEWVRTWSDGRTEPFSRPIYETRTRRCNAGVLTTTGSAPLAGDMNSTGGTVLNLMFGSPDKEAGKTGPPGLRMTGEYGSRAGFDLEFRPEGVVVGCREATILRPYTVQVQSNQVLVKVQHSAAPIALALGADGRLTGTGSVRVDGRAVTGTAADGQIAFAARSATCAVGILPPAQGVSASEAAAPATAQPASAGDAVLALTATAPSASGAVAPAAGRSFMLLNDDLTNVLSQGGFQAAPGQTLYRTIAVCEATDPNCQKGITAIAGHVIAVKRTDAGGQAAFPGVAPGTYYLFGAAGSDTQPVVWNLRVQLKAGDNTVLLDQRNAVPLK